MRRSTLRRLYADLVQGRSHVRITTPVNAPVGVPPIFLVGAYRSGTTLFRLLLDSHPRLACPPETTFIAPLGEVLTQDWARSGFDGLGFDRGHVAHKIRELVSYFYESYAASTGKQRWVDKSPEYVWHLNVIRELFPEASFVLLTRYPLDQVHSHISSEHDLSSRLKDIRLSIDPLDDSRIAAARYWAAAVDAQLAFFRQYPESCVWVRYEDLCQDPEATLRRVLSAVGERFDPTMLDFSRQRHDFGLSDDRARVSNRIQLRTGLYRNWDEEVIQRCLAVTAQQRKALGWHDTFPG